MPTCPVLQGVIEAADRAATNALKTAKFVPARVTVVSFGSPAVGDSTWADNFNKRINARNIYFLGDLLSQVITNHPLVRRGAKKAVDPYSPGMKTMYPVCGTAAFACIPVVCSSVMYHV